MKKLFPLLLALIGSGGGIAAGLALRAPPPEQSDVVPNCPEPAEMHADEALSPPDDPIGEESDGTVEYVKLNNQFIVPVMAEGQVISLVVLSLSVEVNAGNTETVFRREPKLRDVFLSVLFDHAYSGGFNGDFTRSDKMVLLRDALLETARRTLGPIVTDVLVQDINRQDV